MSSKAIVLCGGAGTRLRSVVSDVPKVLAPINGRPFLDYLLRNLTKSGISEVVLATGYKGEQVSEFADQWDVGEPLITCLKEKAPLGTGGAIAHALHQTGWTDPFFVMNGDTFFTGSLKSMQACFEQGGWKAVVAVVRREDTGRYGRVLFDSNSLRAMKFTEKGDSVPGWVNAGLYILHPSIVANMDPGTTFSFEASIIPKLIGEEKIGVCPFPNDDFFDYGTPEAYEAAGFFLSRVVNIDE